ncbi:MAG: short chain dehydrogenase [Capsulimonas sp.]|jgi:NAD(P)-dependent dehydrogenase (short-subunit alcohol dehydrogenase family)|nr:short chain dehydrogenase [Capsulimonas sp.]
MRILVIGASGTIGGPVADALAERHEVLRAARTHGDYHVDISQPESIVQLFESVGEIDALVSVAGSARFKSLEQLTDEDLAFSLANKLMGQVNLVRFGLKSVHDGGSITLTTGVLASEPIPGAAALSLVNGGLESFARAAALDLPRGVRINIVSPPWVSETLVAMGRDGAEGMPAAKVAAAYVASVEGTDTGKIIDARKFA